MKIALCSMNPEWEDKNVNFRACEAALASARKDGAEMVIFPEMTLTGFSMSAKIISEPKNASPSIACFSEACKKHGIAAAFGVVLASQDKFTNALAYVDAEGKLGALYEKRHLFSFANEHEFYTEGAKSAVAKAGGGTLGFSVCYDLRFPDVFTSMKRESEANINIANWPKTRVEHWRTLLKARAIENQAYMIGVNRTGRDGNALEYEKSSMVFDPNGDEVRPSKAGTEIDIYEIDFNRVREHRKKFPFV